MLDLKPNSPLTFPTTLKYVVKEKIYENPGVSAFYKVIDRAENRILGMKVLHTDLKEISKIKKEAAILNKVFEKGGNVPAIYFTHYDRKNQHFIMVMQYLEQMDTMDLYFRKSFNHKRNWQIFKAIVETLKDIHLEGIYHRDLKPQNILIHRSKTKAYIIDFNLSVIQFKGIEGTYNYCAPEQMVESKFPIIQQADVFSMGVMMYEIFTKQLPIIGVHYNMDFGDSTYKKFVEPREIDPSIPREINDFIVKCMALNPKDRYENAIVMERVMKSIRV